MHGCRVVAMQQRRAAARDESGNDASVAILRCRALDRRVRGAIGEARPPQSEGNVLMHSSMKASLNAHFLPMASMQPVKYDVSPMASMQPMKYEGPEHYVQSQGPFPPLKAVREGCGQQNEFDRFRKVLDLTLFERARVERYMNKKALGVLCAVL